MTTGATMKTDEQRLEEMGFKILSDQAKDICAMQYQKAGPIEGCTTCPLARPCRHIPLNPTFEQHQDRIVAINKAAADHEGDCDG